MIEKYLIFRLYGVMASFGKPAIGKLRHSYNTPTKSQVVGLIACSHGIDREEEDKILELSKCEIGIKNIEIGNHLLDFHIVQCPKSNKQYKNRLEEIQNISQNVIAEKEYVSNAVNLIAIKTSSDLEHMKQKLLEPEFSLFIGRLNCPLSLPLDPQIIDADNFIEAFDKFEVKEDFIKVNNKSTRYHLENKIDIPNLNLQRTEEKQDILLKNRNYSSRKEYVYTKKVGS
jgi:CRISPR system Cascade subunit CasD